MPVNLAEAMSFRELSRIIPQRRDPRTIENWARVGLLNRRTGKYVKLETVRLSQGRGSSLAAYYAFMAALDKEE